MKDLLLRGPATCSDMHRAYKFLVREARDDPRCHQTGMTYESFRRQVWCARRVGLIEVLYTAPCRITGTFDPNDCLANQVNVYELTDYGRGAEEEWGNLVGAVRT